MKESNKSNAAFEDYYALGPGRSLAILCQRYQTETEHKPPTRQLSTLKKWSTLFGWQQRVADRDREISDKSKAELEARQTKALTSGFALRFQRVEALNELALKLQDETKEADRVWLPDVKQIGQGDSAVRVDIVRFNAGLIEQFRKTLDDIALEMGERVKGIDLNVDWRAAAKDAGVVNPDAIYADVVKQLKEWLDRPDDGGSMAGSPSPEVGGGAGAQTPTPDRPPDAA